MRKTLLLIVCLLYLPSSFAKDFGVFGKTFTIAEMDLLEFIQQKIQAMQANGQWQGVQADFKNRVKAHLQRPAPRSLARARANRTWLFNPSLTVPYDVQDTKGQVIVQKGTVINPLDRVGLSSTLVFFDGDDASQVDWATMELKQHEKVKLILTSGSIKDATSYFKEAVYFDLNGFLVDKFQIGALPARVLQAGNRLKIEEVAL